MPILTDEAIRAAVERRALLRRCNVSSRLTEQEAQQLDTLAKARRLQRGDCIRQILLAELARADQGVSPTPELTELMGLRLLLNNVLRALVTGQRMTEETFDSLIYEVRRAKVQLAAELLKSQGVR